MLVISGCVPTVTLAQAVPAAAADGMAISTITLERDCFGCAAGSLLVLQRDGSARLTVTGKARHGTEDRISTGRLQPGEFDQLARLAETQGFFGLNDSYDQPELQDGAWSTLGITRAGTVKQVFRRGEAGPAVLQALATAVEALQARITFVAITR